MSVELDLQIASEFEDLPSHEQFELWADKALHAYREHAELTIRIADEAESQELNSQYRGKDKPTNVLSFPFEAPPGIEMNLLGDLIICAPVISREAAEQNKKVLHHYAHMTVHGILHLLGYDHIDDAEAEEMESKEIAILAGLDIENPYEA